MSDDSKPDRLIPETWFRAQTCATTMGFLQMNADRLTPLREGERALGRFVLPPFQRPPVWTEEQQVRFIESCWMGLPIGAIVYNQPNDHYSPTDQWLLDGQQRTTAVYAYMADAFPVFGHLYSETTVIDKRRWSMGINFPTLVTNLTDEAELREVYDRLAYGGTAHEPTGTPSHDR